MYFPLSVLLMEICFKVVLSADIKLVKFLFGVSWTTTLITKSLSLRVLCCGVPTFVSKSKKADICLAFFSRCSSATNSFFLLISCCLISAPNKLPWTCTVSPIAFAKVINFPLLTVTLNKTSTIGGTAKSLMLSERTSKSLMVPLTKLTVSFFVSSLFRTVRLVETNSP